MPITPDMLRAYQEALYRVEGGPLLRIGAPDPALDALLARHKVETAAFVTAANPHGVPRSRVENQAANAAALAGLPWPWIAGEGCDPEGRWDAEPSFLVLGVGRDAALALGRRLEQNAIVFVQRGAAPELVLMRPMRLVLDTQVWLDWLVFDDPAVAGLRSAIERGSAEVLIDAACLAELERVLARPLGRRSVDAAACLAACRNIATRVEVATAAPYTLPLCRDADDQKFLTLAAGAGADCLVSRDRELLRLSRSCSPWLAIVLPQAFGPRPVK